MDCKAALTEAGGNEEKAIEILRKKGLQAAGARGDRDATEGQVFSYVHHNGRLGVLVEVGCETDFVARNQEFQEFGRNACLHVAAMRPAFVSREQVDAAAVEKERKFLVEQAGEQMAGRPDEVIQKAVDGRMQKFFAEKCLLEQVWVKDDAGKKTVDEVQKELAGKIGENIQIRRFVMFELGA
jgi:elongation factor Ts